MFACPSHQNRLDLHANLSGQRREILTNWCHQSWWRLFCAAPSARRLAGHTGKLAPISWELVATVAGPLRPEADERTGRRGATSHSLVAVESARTCCLFELAVGRRSGFVCLFFFCALRICRPLCAALRPSSPTSASHGAFCRARNSRPSGALRRED